MSAICQNFVQNAWKKELCSNCFKSKDEHIHSALPKLPINPNKKIESIIKTNATKKNKHTVSFKNEISKFIGYGGEDWSEIEADPITITEEEPTETVEHEVDEEGERELQRLTKENTEFNTVNSNLLSENNEIKKSFAHLKLGAPKTDSEGRKQTLMVSVTPFGQDSLSMKKLQKAISHIPVAKNKDSLVDNKNSAILTSYISKNEDNIFVEEKSLLEEISETLEKNKTPIHIISLKKTYSSSTDKNKENDSSTTNKSSTYLLEKAAEKSTEKIKDLKLNRLNMMDRKNGITRAPAIKRDQEKPAVYQTSTAKIELLNNKNFKITQDRETSLNKLNGSDKINECDNLIEETKLESVSTNLECSKSELSEIRLSNNKQNPIETDKESSEDTTDISIGGESGEDSSNESGNSLTESTVGEQLEASKELPSQTREQAGEPDGHSNPDCITDIQKSATTPPFVETRSSFLHGSDKPQVPSKPSTVVIRKPTNHVNITNQQQTLTTFTADNRLDLKTIEEVKIKFDKQESSGSDSIRVINKRKAPKPPSLEENTFLKNSNLNLELALLREKEKRASSCSPLPRNEVCTQPGGYTPTEPMSSKRSFSISTDSLIGVGSEEKKKEKTKSRFSLKRFLHLKSSKDTKSNSESPKYEEVNFVDTQAQSKPRLVIVHPLDLNSGKVEVISKEQSSQEEYKPKDNSQFDYRSSKPPPPPRNIQDCIIKGKPNLPHPPKSIDIINKQKHLNKTNHLKHKNDSVYANIGEVRSAIVPHKPQRTASMREREAQEQSSHTSGVYEPINIANGAAKENVYDYIQARSSSPEYDDNSQANKNNKILKALRQGRANSHLDVSGEYFKFQNIPRSASLTYCGSETESEIYSPHSFCGSESEIADEEQEWVTPNGRTYKLRSRKGRSIVHKNLEDNYGAVIIANHEALAQVLENIQQGPPIQPALRGLKTIPNLMWNDFSVKDNLPPLIVGHRIFHQAVWGAHHVTLVITKSSTPTTSLSLGTFNLVPITEFTDLVPVKYLIDESENEVLNLVQSSISVFPWLQINTIQSYSDLLKTKSMSSTQEDVYKDACFVILQMVNALKMLQAQGIEELPLTLTSFVLCREMEKDTYHRLCVLQGLGEEISQKKENVTFGSLCSCATTVLNHLLPNSKLTPLLRSLLNTERAVSLSQVKSILEFALWGPSDVVLSSNLKDRELTLQRWLDLQRATVLHGLVCARIQLTVYEECHLLFLVRSNSKMMCDASLLWDSSNKQNMVVNGRK